MLGRSPPPSTDPYPPSTDPYPPFTDPYPPSTDPYPLGYDAYGESAMMETVARDNDLEKVNIFIVFVFILELLVLVFVSVLEYFLRETDVFPLRDVPFSCGDDSLSYKHNDGLSTFGNFAYQADVPYAVILPICFCLPPVLVVISELALWAFTEDAQKTVRALCTQCKVPQILRRMVRFIGSFIFGLLITMIFVDVTKLFVGRPRPTFLETCSPNVTACATGDVLSASTVCQPTSQRSLREARMSFPSLHAAMTAYVACFLAIYLHNVIRSSSVRVMRPFLALSFVLCSVMCCLARYGLHYSHWTDVLVGFGVGTVFALYIGIFVLNNFRERLSSRRLYHQLRDFMFEQRALELRDFYKEERLGYSTYPGGGGVYAGGFLIPRPQVNANGQTTESSTDENIVENVVELSQEQLATYPPPRHPTHPSHPVYTQQRKPSKPGQNTFQRDLSRTLDQYRPGPVTGYGHM